MNQVTKKEIVVEDEPKIKTWLRFAGMCSVVIVIILATVLMGGYSSYYRAKNRIQAAKEMLVTDYQKRFDNISQLLAVQSDNSYEAAINDAVEQIKNIFKSLDPEKKGFTDNEAEQFLQARSKLNDNLDKILNQIDKNSKIFIKMKESKKDTQFSIDRYNHHVGYLNTRISIFPGYLLAPLFKIDNQVFLE